MVRKSGPYTVASPEKETPRPARGPVGALFVVVSRGAQEVVEGLLPPEERCLWPALEML